MRSNLYLKLFISFFKIGAFTFGGGWAMIPLIEREVVDKQNWIKREDFVDALAIAQSLPGVLAVNISILIGNKLRGLKGCLMATLGYSGIINLVRRGFPHLVRLVRSYRWNTLL